MNIKEIDKYLKEQISNKLFEHKIQKISRELINEELGVDPNSTSFKSDEEAGEISANMLMKMFGREASAIRSELMNSEIINDNTDGTVNEGLGLLAGGALSLGKIGELAGSGLSKIGKKLDSNVLQRVGTYLEHKGHAYTHGIENGIVKLLDLVPTIKKLNLTPEQKDIIAKSILTAIIGGLAISSGAGAIKALASGENIMGVIESALTGVKSAEIATNIPKIAEGVIEHLFTTV